MSSPRWRTVIFDLDGTLVDTIGLIVASYRHAFEAVLDPGTPPVPEERIRAWIGQPLIRAFREVSTVHADALNTAYLTWNEANTGRLIREYAGVRELLTRLAAAGVRVAVVTSKRRTHAELALGLAGLSALVGALVAMEDTTEHKPRPEPLLLALDRLGAPAGEAVYVGDAVVDLEAAHTAGIASVGVTWGAGVRADLVGTAPTALADTVAELTGILMPEPGQPGTPPGQPLKAAGPPGRPT